MVLSASADTLFNRLTARARPRHLQLVLEVAELGNLRQAAPRLGLTQSAASKLIADIEDALETPLFERHARGMRPTFACRDLLPLFRQFIAMLGGCAEAAAATASGIHTTVRIGAITAGIHGVLDPVLPAFLLANPQVRIEVFEHALPKLLERYNNNELDLLITRCPMQSIPGSEFVPLLSDQFLIVARPEHPLAGKRRVRPPQMLSYPWAEPPIESLAYQAFLGIFHALGGLPEHRPLATRSLSAIIHYLQHSDALLVGSSGLMRGALNDGSVVSLKYSVRDQLPPLGLIHRVQPRNQSTMQFEQHLLQVIPTISRPATRKEVPPPSCSFEREATHRRRREGGSISTTGTNTNSKRS